MKSLAILAIVLAALTASITQAAPPTPTVVLVHGWAGSPSDMSTMANRLQQLGYRTMSPSLPSWDARTNAISLANTVKQINGPVYIVGFSMGGLEAVDVVKNLGATNVVKVVTIDTPWIGATDPFTCAIVPSLCETGTYLTQLKAGPDVPPGVQAAQLINTWPGASAYIFDVPSCTIPVYGYHPLLPAQTDVINKVAAFLGGTCPASAARR